MTARSSWSATRANHRTTGRRCRRSTSPASSRASGCSCGAGSSISRAAFRCASACARRRSIAQHSGFGSPTAASSHGTSCYFASAAARGGSTFPARIFRASTTCEPSPTSMQSARSLDGRAQAGGRRRGLHRARGRGLGPPPRARSHRARSRGPADAARRLSCALGVLPRAARARGRADPLQRRGERVYRRGPGAERRMRRTGVPGGRGDYGRGHRARRDARRGGGAQVRQRDLGRRVLPDVRSERLCGGRLHQPSERPLRAPRFGSSQSTMPSSRAASRRRASAARTRGTTTCRGSGRTSTTSSCRSRACRRATTRPSYAAIPLRGHFAIYYLLQGELIAVDAVNSPKDFMSGRRWIAERRHPDAAKLADPGVDLKTL